jgi:hypothetical protein
MPRRARRYDLFLPTNYNDGRRIPRKLFGSLEAQLLARFGGVTSQRTAFPLRGIWQGQTRVYIDSVIVVTIFDFRPRRSDRFFGNLKDELLEEFAQDEILITELSLRVH